jgi:opacity protein-like surface antigen
MKKIFLILSIAGTATLSTFGQGLWSVSYDMGVPLGDFSDFIAKASFRGFSINGNYFVTDNITVGGTFHWSGYHEHIPRSTYQPEDGSVTGEVWKNMYFVPLLINARYILGAAGQVQPYGGIGMGPCYVEQSTQVGSYADSPRNWKFGLAPEAGVFIPFGGRDMGLNLKATYNAVFYNIGDISTLSYLQFSVGFGIYSW